MRNSNHPSRKNVSINNSRVGAKYKGIGSRVDSNRRQLMDSQGNKRLAGLSNSPSRLSGVKSGG